MRETELEEKVRILRSTLRSFIASTFVLSIAGLVGSIASLKYEQFSLGILLMFVCLVVSSILVMIFESRI